MCQRKFVYSRKISGSRSARKVGLNKKIMRRFLILTAIAIATSSCARNSAEGSIDSNVHKMCLQANDYMGCVKAQSSQSSDMPSLRVIQGKTELTGNSCPAQFRYSGAGFCTRVVCSGNHFRHHPDLKDKGMSCGFFERLQWGNGVVKAVSNPGCPDREPIIGTDSSCTTLGDLYQMQATKKSKKTIACRNGTLDKNHPRCKEAGITSPMDMD